MTDLPRVTVWNEFVHERRVEAIGKMYPEGMHGAIANHLRSQGLTVQTATLDQPEHGLTDEVLANTDVLIWWGHMAHAKVSDEVVNKVHKRITDKGMGLVVLHSGHFSKIFKKLMGTSCDLKWRRSRRQGTPVGRFARSPPLSKAWASILSFLMQKCMANILIFPKPDQLVLVSWFEGRRGFSQWLLLLPGTWQDFLLPSRS